MLRPDLPAPAVHQLPGHRQAKTVARQKAPGAVQTVKAVKDPLQLLLRDGFAGVGHGQQGVPPPVHRKADRHGSAGQAVLHRVVQQNVEHLGGLLAVGADHHALRRLRSQRQPRLVGHGLEGQSLRSHHGAEIHRRQLPPGGDLGVGAGQLQHIQHQSPHPVRLPADVSRPALERRVLLGAVRQDHLRVGEDHRQRRLQLVGGVGHELGLLLPGPAHGPDDQSRQKPGEGQKHRQQSQPQQQAVPHLPQAELSLEAVVGKHQPPAAGDARPVVAQLVAAQIAEVLLRCQDLGRQIQQLLVADIELSLVGVLQHPAPVHQQSEIGDSHLSREDPAPHGRVRLRQRAEHLLALADHAGDSGAVAHRAQAGVDRHQKQQHHHGQPPLHRPDHASASRRW